METTPEQSAADGRISFWRRLFFSIAVLWPALSADAATLDNLFFLHHSTGGGLISGGMRETIAGYNAAHGTAFAFWDHGYNGEGLRDASGNFTGNSYEIPGDNTDPDGLYYLWTSANDDAAACRGKILANHGVIAFKSCFPAANIPDEATLNQYKAWYLAMRDVFDRHPDRLFVVMSTPPLHRLATDAAQANNARLFANWLKSSEYLSGRANIVCFDLFDCLAGNDHMLKYEYENSHDSSDSHPNATANQTVGPLFANFLIASALNYNSPPSRPAVPIIKANGARGELTVNSAEPVSVTVEITANDYAGTAVDWWLVGYAHSYGWHYGLSWTPFNGDLGICQPAYQGKLFNLSAMPVMDRWLLPPGIYDFWFAVDYPMDAILDLNGTILIDTVRVVVE
ncbi:MAG: hypothetical protein PHP98_07695 [Kiritimatiellae bacterium]|jgi:hypothetical protein|nr:hypothetical protein [Kiritimatiellia bacterium]